MDIHPEKTITGKDPCTPIFIAALFTMARTWKQSRCLLTDEWIKKLWYNGILYNGIFIYVYFMYTMEYYSAIKRNAFESALVRWRNLEPIIQSEVSQKEKNKHCILT